MAKSVLPRCILNSSPQETFSWAFVELGVMVSSNMAAATESRGFLDIGIGFGLDRQNRQNNLSLQRSRRRKSSLFCPFRGARAEVCVPGLPLYGCSSPWWG